MLSAKGAAISQPSPEGWVYFLSDEGVRYDPDLARSMFSLALDLFHHTLAVG